MGDQTDSTSDLREDTTRDTSKRNAILSNGGIGIVTVLILVFLELIYACLVKGPANVNLTEVFTVPFDLLLITFSLLAGAYFEEYTNPRDMSWFVLLICTILIYVSATVAAIMAAKAGGPESVPEFQRNLFVARPLIQ